MSTNANDPIFGTTTYGETFPDITGKIITNPDVTEGALTKLEYFANSAPNEIPQWFHPEFEDLEPTVDYSDTVADVIFTQQIHTHQEWVKKRDSQKFFAWRVFYAKSLIAELNKEEPEDENS